MKVFYMSSQQSELNLCMPRLCPMKRRELPVGKQAVISAKGLLSSNSHHKKMTKIMKRRLEKTDRNGLRRRQMLWATLDLKEPCRSLGATNVLDSLLVPVLDKNHEAAGPGHELHTKNIEHHQCCKQ